MAQRPSRFVWFELMTTDIAAAKAFYADVIGWRTQDASTPDLDYVMFAAGEAPVAGLIGLPEEARKMGATPRWAGYVGVDDVDAAADKLRRSGGAVYVPPTDSNIGRIAIVADPQAASLALVEGLKVSAAPATEFEPGHIGWHELYAADHTKVLSFYAELFGWQQAKGVVDQSDSYQLFSAGGAAIGGLMTKRPTIPSPFWLHYFNVDDLDAALRRVTTGGGRVFNRAHQLPSGDWMAHCVDPHGAVFALQGARKPEAIAQDPPAEINWSSSWGGTSSRGRLTVRKPRD